MTCNNFQSICRVWEYISVVGRVNNYFALTTTTAFLLLTVVWSILLYCHINRIHSIKCFFSSFHSSQAPLTGLWQLELLKWLLWAFARAFADLQYIEPHGLAKRSAFANSYNIANLHIPVTTQHYLLSERIALCPYKKCCFSKNITTLMIFCCH